MNKIKKIKSTWIPGFNLFIKQLGVSFVSYITLPFFKKKDNGVLLFFEKNNDQKKDELVFDGDTGNYYNKINNSEIINILSNANVLDLGCGNSSFYFWLIDKHIPFKSYIGLDFAAKKSISLEKCLIVKENLLNFSKYLSIGKNVILLCNVLCYLTDDELILLLEKIPTNSFILILDPAPGLFWDAHFSGIRPNYRKIKSVIRILQLHSFFVNNTTQDYLVSLNDAVFLFPLSYSICAKKTNEYN